jgi:hypothetical protein
MMKRIGASLLLIVASFATLQFPNAQAAYAFTSHTFTACGVTGPSGPDVTTCRSIYSTTWDQDNDKYNVVSGIQYWTVPATGRYYIDAYGAGGNGNYGGGGARIADTFDLTEGEVIRILVGQIQTGTNTAANAGSGGTFVVRTPFNTNGSILIIAGGGGGTESGVSQNLVAHASINTDANNGSGTVSATGAGSGGINGSGGTSVASSNGGGGGGGFFTDGGTNSWMDNKGGIAFVNGGGGGPLGSISPSRPGGFGGGGASRGSGMGGGAGGGGGYSGGGSGDNLGGASGGGGSSYYANGLNINRIRTVNANPAATAGYVTITKIAEPTITLSVSGSTTQLVKGQSIALTATIDYAGKVTFFADGKRIAKCIGISAQPGNVVCNWKPTVQKPLTITASYIPTGGTTVKAEAIALKVAKRATNR